MSVGVLALALGFPSLEQSIAAQGRGGGAPPLQVNPMWPKPLLNPLGLTETALNAEAMSGSGTDSKRI